ncbi:MAG: two-component system chemotaxis response regulator CheY [Kiritimatiellia bacterium]|jgi:two-component system chemotaxis response regulator CheY
MMNALIVDDSRIMRMVIRSHLVSCGFSDAQIYEAQDGRDALQKMEEVRPDLVLSDINMPVMDGEQLLYYLADSGFLEQGRAVMVTSRYERRLFRRLLHAGATAVIRKPFTPSSFHRQLEPVLHDLKNNVSNIAFFKGEGTSAPAAVVPPVRPVPNAPQPQRNPFSRASNEDRAKVAARSTAQILHTLGVEGQEAAIEQAPVGTLYFADVEVEGPPKEQLVLYGDSAVCDLISQRMVGVSASTDEGRADVMGEIANIVVGRYLVEATGPEHNRKFSTPQSGTVGSDEVLLENFVAVNIAGGGVLYVGIVG